MFKMIKSFENITIAKRFAEKVKGKIEIKYDWDALKGKMIKEFIVKF